MFKKKALTLPELEVLEAEKLKEKATMQSEIDEWRSKRPAIMRNIAESITEGDEATNKAAREELRKGDERERFLKTEIEIIGAYLQTFSRQRDRAQGEEIEKLIPRIRKMNDGIQPLVDEILKKTVELDMANQKLLDYLKLFDELKGTRDLNLKYAFIDLGVSGLNRYARIPGVLSDSTEIPLSTALVNAVCDREKLEALINAFKSSIAKKMDLMSDHAKRLQGEEIPKLEWPYCPNCYKACQQPDKTGKVLCQNCKKVVEPVW